MRALLFSCLAALPLLFAGISSANPAPTPLSGPLVTAIEKAAARLPAGGFVLSQVEHGQSSFQAFGAVAPAPDIPPEKIIFEIGSISKVFTALLLAETVQEHRAALTDPISKFLPADLQLDPAVAAITLEQLATHTSGLPRLPDNFAPADRLDPYADYTVDRLYAFLRAYHPAAPAPRPAAYSNLGFGLLGHILELIHGQPYARLLADRISTPLGLTDTVVTLSPDQAARFATPYSGSETVKPWQLGALAGAGAIRSTAADLAKFAQALLTPADTPLHAAWELIRQPRAPFGGGGARIGLAILMTERDGATIYDHSGGTGGFRADLELVPAAGRATILLLDNDVLEPAQLVAGALRPPPPADSTSRESVTLTAGQLAAFPGVYAIDARARFTAVLDALGQLRIRLTGQPFVPAYPLGHDRFFLKVVAAEYQFDRDPAGRVDRLTLHQNDHTVEARRTDEPPPHVIFLSPDKLSEYTGRFQLAPGVLFEVTARGDTLFVKLTGQPAFPVFCDASDHFVYDVVPAALTFERDATGAVTALILHQNGQNPRAPRL